MIYGVTNRIEIYKTKSKQRWLSELKHSYLSLKKVSNYIDKVRYFDSVVGNQIVSQVVFPYIY